MSFKTLTACAMLVLGAGGAAMPALAQGIETIASPAEMPPGSFQGGRYVDSRGCVFVRAGFDGAVIWVPQMTRDGDQVCGYAPSLGGASRRAAAEPAPAPAPVPAPAPAPAAVAEPAPEPTPAPAPRVATAPEPRPQPQAAPAPRPAPKPAATVRRPRPAPVGQPMRTVASKPAPVVKAPASKPPSAPPPELVRRVPAPAAAPAPQPKRVITGSTCPPGFTGEMRRNGMAVRCGPQTSPFVTEVRRGEAPGPGKTVYRNGTAGRKGSWEDSNLSVGRRDRLVPAHVYREGPAAHTVTPAGYRPAWEDDRLNPYRAWQTVDGYYDTQQVWTNTVPRDSAATARTHSVRDPILLFPGVPGRWKPVVEEARYRSPAMSTRSDPPLRSATVSTRSEPQRGDARYVEIGAFTSAGGAAEAARRLQGAGLPVRLSQMSHAGQEMRRVRVGPYHSSTALRGALSAVQATGYVQAYLR